MSCRLPTDLFVGLVDRNVELARLSSENSTKPCDWHASSPAPLLRVFVPHLACNCSGTKSHKNLADNYVQESPEGLVRFHLLLQRMHSKNLWRVALGKRL